MTLIWLSGTPRPFANRPDPKASMISAKLFMAFCYTMCYRPSIPNLVNLHATLHNMVGDPKTQSMAEQGKRLKAAREEAGFRTASAAVRSFPKSAKVKIPTYGAHERGTRAMGPDDAEKYAKRFSALGANVTASDILFGRSKSDDNMRDAAILEERLAPMLETAFLSVLAASDPNSNLSSSELQLLAAVGVQSVLAGLSAAPSRIFPNSREDADRHFVALHIREALRKEFAKLNRG